MGITGIKCGQCPQLVKMHVSFSWNAAHGVLNTMHRSCEKAHQCKKTHSDRPHDPKKPSTELSQLNGGNTKHMSATVSHDLTSAADHRSTNSKCSGENG